MVFEIPIFQRLTFELLTLERSTFELWSLQGPGLIASIDSRDSLGTLGEPWGTLGRPRDVLELLEIVVNLRNFEELPRAFEGLPSGTLGRFDVVILDVFELSKPRIFASWRAWEGVMREYVRMTITDFAVLQESKELIPGGALIEYFCEYQQDRRVSTQKCRGCSGGPPEPLRILEGTQRPMKLKSSGTSGQPRELRGRLGVAENPGNYRNPWDPRGPSGPRQNHRKC